MSRTLWVVIGSCVLLLLTGCSNQITPAGTNGAVNIDLAQTIADLVASVRAFLGFTG